MPRSVPPVTIRIDSALEKVLIRGGCWPGPPPDGPDDPYGLAGRDVLVRDLLDLLRADSLANRLSPDTVAVRLGEVLGKGVAIEMNLSLVGGKDLPVVKPRSV
ncbi:MAG: hypothetical protein FWD18_04480 [Micrococcales bacterium]|nr:hypothetical protein [Micrococcales bacterium]